MSNAVVVKDRTGGYLTNPDGSVLVFESKKAALQYAWKERTRRTVYANGFIRSIGTCRRCGSPLFPSDIPESGYKSQCFTCDEDFFGFEQDTE